MRFSSSLLIRSKQFIAVFLVGCLLISASACGQQPSSKNSEEGFETVRRRGAVDIAQEYDLSGLTIPQKQIHMLVRKDGIPALTDPKLEQADEATWLQPSSRIIEVAVGGEVLGVPLNILDRHEIVNTQLGGEPIAITYCPLCDSATIFSRRVRAPSGNEGSDTKKQEIVLEFGVSGALYNSNVLMYDRTHSGLWSQLGMKAVSGPLVGTELSMLPVKMVTFSQYQENHPQGNLVSRDTGHGRNYERAAYGDYFKTDRIIVPILGVGDALPRKTLGVGVVAGKEAYFIALEAIPAEGYLLETALGPVKLAKTDAGIVVQDKPTDVRAAQTFYYSWSAFYPETRVISTRAEKDLHEITH
jgi:hypothetical protein